MVTWLQVPSWFFCNPELKNCWHGLLGIEPTTFRSLFSVRCLWLLSQPLLYAIVFPSLCTWCKNKTNTNYENPCKTVSFPYYSFSSHIVCNLNVCMCHDTTRHVFMVALTLTSLRGSFWSPDWGLRDVDCQLRRDSLPSTPSNRDSQRRNTQRCNISDWTPR